VTDDELRIAILRGRRITRDPGLLEVLDEFERRLNTKVVNHRGLRGGPGPPSKDDHRIKKALYMKKFMREYRAKKKREAMEKAGKIDQSTGD
jgi:hypothetical protein